MAPQSSTCTPRCLVRVGVRDRIKVRVGVSVRVRGRVGVRLGVGVGVRGRVSTPRCLSAATVSGIEAQPG